MLELKPISRDAIPQALVKAERYRLLNEPGQAESICLDVLAVDPSNQEARVLYILALTDQFSHFGPHEPAVISRAEEAAAELDDEYARAVLRRHHLRASRRGPAGARRSRIRRDRARMAQGCARLLRPRRGAASSRQRRRDPAVERVRAHARAASGPVG